MVPSIGRALLSQPFPVTGTNLLVGNQGMTLIHTYTIPCGLIVGAKAFNPTLKRASFGTRLHRKKACKKVCQKEFDLEMLSL